jgi:hypothetical protein
MLIKNRQSISAYLGEKKKAFGMQFAESVGSGMHSKIQNIKNGETF